MKLTDDEMIEIEKAIESAEQQAEGQIVPAIMDSSDHYPAAHFRAAIIGAFLAAVVTYLYVPILSIPMMLLAQLGGLVIGYALAFIPSLKILLSRGREIDEEVHQRALEVFFNHNIHQTESRRGILIFISRFERRIELIADIGLQHSVTADQWKGVVGKMVEQMKHKNYKQAMLDGIDACAEILKNTPHEHHESCDCGCHEELSNSLIRE